jgi:hypothetical protein
VHDEERNLRTVSGTLESACPNLRRRPGHVGSASAASSKSAFWCDIIRMGALDDDPGIRPSAHQFVDYAAPWEPLPDDGLPRVPERLPAGERPRGDTTALLSIW